MKKARFLLSLTNDDNDYQVEQASAAKQAAIKRGIELEIIITRELIPGLMQCQWAVGFSGKAQHFGRKTVE